MRQHAASVSSPTIRHHSASATSLSRHSSRESFNLGSLVAANGSALDLSRVRTLSAASSTSPTAHTESGASGTASAFGVGASAQTNDEGMPSPRSSAELRSAVEQTPRESQSSPVRVIVRLCPLSSDQQEVPRAWVVDPGSNSVDTPDFQYHFHYDRAFPEEATQESVYENVGRPIVIDVMQGYHGTVLAYGQTGTGKTYSIFGPPVSHGPDAQGLVPRAAHHIFDYIGANFNEKNKFAIECYFFEVYCEQLRDLLKPGNTKLQIKELPPKGCYVEGLTRKSVNSVNEVIQVLRVGLKQRAAANTRLNQHSSRSHAIFTLRVQQQTPDGAMQNGKLTLVDLAGSEKVHKSCSAGDMLEEAKKINLSLSTLGHVIDALVDRRPHVPYRDSRLTRILEDSLGGNCRTTLLCTCSSNSVHFSETLSSLRFAARAKKVTNFTHVNVTYACDKQLLNRIAQLRTELSKAHRKLERQFSTDSDLNSSMHTSHKRLSHCRSSTQDTIDEHCRSSTQDTIDTMLSTSARQRAPTGASKEDHAPTGASKEDIAFADSNQSFGGIAASSSGSLRAPSGTAAHSSSERRLSPTVSWVSGTVSINENGHVMRTTTFVAPPSSARQDSQSPQQMVGDIQDLQIRLQVERQRSASLSVELAHRTAESKNLSTQLGVRESQAQSRAQLESFIAAANAFPVTAASASTAVHVATMERLVSSVILSPRHVAAPPNQVVRRISSSATPIRPPSTVQLSSVSSTVHIPSTIHAPATAASSSSRVTLCTTQTASSPKIPWASPRVKVASPSPARERKESPTRCQGLQSPSTPLPPPGARSASPLQRMSSTGSSCLVPRIALNGPRSARIPVVCAAKHTVVFSPREAVVRTVARVSAESSKGASTDSPTKDSKEPRWLP